jgi:hypothetical protein
VVVVSFPGEETIDGGSESIEPLATPEFFLVDPVTAFDLPVLLGAPWPDVAMPNPRRLDRQCEGERKLVAVIALQLPDPEGDARQSSRRNARLELWRSRR